MLTQLLYQRRVLFLSWLVVFLIGLIWVTFKPPEAVFIFAKGYYHDSVHIAFRWLTKLGEELGFVLGVILVVLYANKRALAGYVLASLITLIVVWVLKHYVYPDAARPAIYLERLNFEFLHPTDHQLNRSYSFPSGHTTAAFTYFFFVALCSRHIVLTTTCMSLAILTGVSRIYLTQHFVVDVVAGSLLGVFIAVTAYLLMVAKRPWPGSFLDKAFFASKVDE